MKSISQSRLLLRLNSGSSSGQISGLHSRPNPESKANPGFYVGPAVKLRTEVRKFPLTGIKVALLNRPSIGDFAAKILEDYGAEVKKFSEVENFPIPNKDWTNSDFIKLYVFGTLQPHEKNGKSQETRIDLTRKEDINLIKNIANKVDVIIDCLEAQRLEKVGLDPKEMMKLNSKLIVARITGYGQTGTFAPRTGADTTFSALSGAMSGIESSEDPTEEGLKIATRESKALTMAGRSNCVTGVILALYDREHTGKGQIVDMSLTESIAYVDRVAHLTKLQVPKTFHRFYSTLDKKLLAG
ncbi:hypothetical protein FO519_008460 [Halicephalobus sp. NKZ332]|nr:hypothetical protein FO519_008460 [Halicephalobus sp. NKZ332]